MTLADGRNSGGQLSRGQPHLMAARARASASGGQAPCSGLMGLYYAGMEEFTAKDAKGDFYENIQKRIVSEQFVDPKIAASVGLRALKRLRS